MDQAWWAKFVGPLAQGVLDNRQLSLSPRISPVPHEVCRADIFGQLYTLRSRHNVNHPDRHTASSQKVCFSYAKQVSSWFFTKEAQIHQKRCHTLQSFGITVNKHANWPPGALLKAGNCISLKHCNFVPSAWTRNQLAYKTCPKNTQNLQGGPSKYNQKNVFS